MHDDQYTATGPSHHTSGFKRSAFSTSNPSDFLQGVNVQGLRCGVLGEGLLAETETAEGSSTLPGVGVEGRGANAGVIGVGRQDAIASVFGQGNRSRIGVLGAVMDRKSEGIGVVGASVKNMGNPLETFASIPEPADGSGVGVLGTSGRGPGVRGSSAGGNGGEFSSGEGSGVTAESGSGVAVRAVSSTNRAGEFKTGDSVAQIRLVPHEQRGGELALPKDGKIGDLILIRTTAARGPIEFLDQCSLWLCVPASVVTTAGAMWREIQLGNSVEGTV
jgi:hypothetical protein